MPIRRNSVQRKLLFPGMPFERAKDIVKMLLDNGVESGVWINVLDDMEIDFIVAE